jgi:hypothetical protein
MRDMRCTPAAMLSSVSSRSARRQPVAVVPQHLLGRQDGGQRRAELVAGHRHEAGAQLVQRLLLLQRLAHLGFDFLRPVMSRKVQITPESGSLGRTQLPPISTQNSSPSRRRSCRSQV